ncbi:hypothetical protein JTE90_022786 [Oedothorax gibbosus]|uniref:Uncharacterized protein n=1 Tax=Oedothorax gibbosus TaxID=931172 RepID=A0AAV6UA97_9ARAC|nr:hypothetical protein JTE90_022786 [Oedothorax gibbosus]
MKAKQGGFSEVLSWAVGCYPLIKSKRDLGQRLMTAFIWKYKMSRRFEANPEVQDQKENEEKDGDSEQQWNMF